MRLKGGVSAYEFADPEEMFRISTTNGTKIRSIFEVLKPYVRECNLWVTPEFMRITTKDALELSMTFVQLEPCFFQTYECTQSVLVGLDTSVFWKIIKGVSKSDLLTFAIDTADSHELTVSLEDATRKRVSEVTALDLDDLPFEIVLQEPQLTITFPSALLNSIVKDIHLLEGRDLEIMCDEDQLTFSSRADPVRVRTTLRRQAEDVVFSDVARPFLFLGVYTMSNLLNIIKGTHLSENITICLRNNYPLMFKYDIEDLGVMKFFLQ